MRLLFRRRSVLAGLMLAVCLALGAGVLPRAFAEDKLPFDEPKDPNALPEYATVETNKGSFKIKFYRDVAPITVANFLYLGKKGFYNNLLFHRYVPGFVIQGGDPQGNGKGGPGWTLPPEYSQIPHRVGSVGMARRPSPINPERRSNGSQFYICLTESRHLDGLYTVFGEVVEGMDNVRKLRQGDSIVGVTFEDATTKDPYMKTERGRS